MDELPVNRAAAYLVWRELKDLQNDHIKLRLFSGRKGPFHPSIQLELIDKHRFPSEVSDAYVMAYLIFFSASVELRLNDGSAPVPYTMTSRILPYSDRNFVAIIKN